MKIKAIDFYLIDEQKCLQEFKESKGKLGKLEKKNCKNIQNISSFQQIIVIDFSANNFYQIFS